MREELTFLLFLVIIGVSNAKIVVVEWPVTTTTFSIAIKDGNWVTVHSARGCLPYGALITFYINNTASSTTIGELSIVGTEVEVEPVYGYTFSKEIPDIVIVTPQVICSEYETTVMQSTTSITVITTPTVTVITRFEPLTRTITSTTLFTSVNELGITIFKTTTTTTKYTTIETIYDTLTITTNATITRTTLSPTDEKTFSNIRFVLDVPAVVSDIQRILTNTTIRKWAYHESVYLSIPVSVVINVPPITSKSSSIISSSIVSTIDTNTENVPAPLLLALLGALIANRSRKD